MSIKRCLFSQAEKYLAELINIITTATSIKPTSYFYKSLVSTYPLHAYLYYKSTNQVTFLQRDNVSKLLPHHRGLLLAVYGDHQPSARLATPPRAEATGRCTPSVEDTIPTADSITRQALISLDILGIDYLLLRPGKEPDRDEAEAVDAAATEGSLQGHGQPAHVQRRPRTRTGDKGSDIGTCADELQPLE